MTEDEMVGCYHQPNGHEFKQAPGVGEGQGSLMCGLPWSRKESDTTEGLSPFMIFPVVMYGCERWTIKKAECQKIVLEKTLESTLHCKEIKPVNPK